MLTPGQTASGRWRSARTARSRGDPDSNGRAYLWDPKTGHQLTVLKDPSGIAVLGVSFSPDSQMLATADQNGHTYLWKVA
ncbi:MAG: hypothetical protein ACRDPY_38325 [Streptosporangiaceae bacterium]